MSRTQGRHFQKYELERIVHLLRETELTLTEIALRMHCSRSAIASINRKLQIRSYQGQRTRWFLEVNVGNPT